MVLVGFYLGLHDSSVCAVVEGRVLYRKFERLSGEKHQRARLSDVVDTCAAWRIKPDYVAYSDGNRNGLGVCDIDELFKRVDNVLAPLTPRQSFLLDHHYAHCLSTWPHAPTPAGALAVALDGRGDNNLRCRVVRLDSGPEVSQVWRSTEFVVGRFFSRVGARMGLAGDELDFPGKVMGAQAYGDLDWDLVERLRVEPAETLPGRLLSDIPWKGRVPLDDETFFAFSNPSFRSWLATCHYALSEALIRFFLACGADGEKVLYTGGCAQNSVFNEALCRRFPGLLITPSAYDGGMSLGCVEFLRRYLDLPPVSMPNYPFVQDDEDVGYAGHNTVKEVARLLESGKIVGWMQGNGEIGPRALGHRSILVDPRLRRAKDLLNQRVKRREIWRPYAASVCESDASRWFDLESPSPFMLRAVGVHSDVACQIPAVVHEDGTCRVQTVSDDPAVLGSFHALLREFEGLTGLPILLNTSLNGGGEPIHGFPAQAQRLLKDGRLDALCVGDQIWRSS